MYSILFLFENKLSQPTHTSKTCLVNRVWMNKSQKQAWKTEFSRGLKDSSNHLHVVSMCYI